MHGPAPEHRPLHPTKTLPSLGIAVNETAAGVSLIRTWLHVPVVPLGVTVQSIARDPAPPTIRPLPVPAPLARISIASTAIAMVIGPVTWAVQSVVVRPPHRNRVVPFTDVLVSNLTPVPNG